MSFQTRRSVTCALYPALRGKAQSLFSQLKRVAEEVSLLRRSGETRDLFTTTDQYGALAYIPASYPRNGPASIKTAAQFFQNGEIWCISSELIIAKRGHHPEFIQLPFIPSFQFEQAYYMTLKNLIESLRNTFSKASPGRLKQEWSARKRSMSMLIPKPIPTGLSTYPKSLFALN